MDINEAKSLVIKAGINLAKCGLIARTWGNVSCRVDENTFVITPSGRNYNSLTLFDIVEVNILDLSYSGNIKPSSEKGIHAEVYKLYPNINFVIHTHQENASVIAASSLDSIFIRSEEPSLNGDVLCAKYALPGTKSLKKNVAEALKISKTNAVIMKYHGAICFGKDYDETFRIAEKLEKACEDYVIRYYLKLAKKDKYDLVEMCNFVFPNKKTTASYEKSEIYDYILRNNKDINHIIFATSPYILAISKAYEKVDPILDDFAQIAGTHVKVIQNDKIAISRALKKSPVVFIKNIGAVCCGKIYDDAEAVSMVTSKACKAIVGASLFGKIKPINHLECMLMRGVYLKKYSKKALNK